MRIHGDALLPDQVVTINGRKVLSDVKELDTEEGWVDVFLPDIQNAVNVDKATQVQIDSELTTMFDWVVKRLEGQVIVVSLNDEK
jgi:hypothetical protein